MDYSIPSTFMKFFLDPLGTLIPYLSRCPLLASSLAIAFLVILPIFMLSRMSLCAMEVVSWAYQPCGSAKPCK